MQYIYLHGFASGNNALKPSFFKKQFAKSGIDLIIPDLNEDDFANLTMTRQINTVNKLIDPDSPLVLLGSSMGGLLALILAERLDNVKKLILFAPALQMGKRWSSNNQERLSQWKIDGYINVYHHDYKQDARLNYSFVEDLLTYEDGHFNKVIPTLIFHGVRDESVPHELSINYAQGKTYVQYHELDSDHSLEDKVRFMWQKINAFL